MKKLTLTMLFLVAAIVANAATPMLGTNVATVERMYQFIKSIHEEISNGVIVPLYNF